MSLPLASLSQAASFIDPHMREAKGLIDGIMMRTPGLRQLLPVKRDPLYGDPRPNPGYLTLLRHVPAADPIKIDMENVGYFPTKPANHIGGVLLTREQYDKYQATAGPAVHKALNALVSRPGFDQLPAGVQRKQFEDTVKRMRELAARTIQMENQAALMKAGRERREKFNKTGSKKLAIQE